MKFVTGLVTWQHRPVSNPFFQQLVCGHCGESHDRDRPQSLCTVCGGPLLAQYRLDAGGLPSLEEVLSRPAGQFRFYETAPTDAGPATPSLGEGATPLLHAPALGVNYWVKDESQNPTGSFKSRGMAVAIARAVELGLRRFALPSNGNAGGAAAAYGALHGVDVEVVMPRATPANLVGEPAAYGARVTLVDGTIADAGAAVNAMCASGEIFNLATLREPYRVEGKKVMGYELFWDLGRLPDVIIYPTGGGTGLVGMVKAFDEMEQLGWIGDERPRMVAVQVDTCAPIVTAFNDGAESAAHWADAPETAAYGLRVPSAVGDRLMLAGLRSTGGTAVAVSETEMLEATRRLARFGGIWGTPEGGACLAAADQLVESGWATTEDTVVIFNTAAAAKYL
jgi:threonine synthase